MLATNVICVTVLCWTSCQVIPQLTSNTGHPPSGEPFTLQTTLQVRERFISTGERRIIWRKKIVRRVNKEVGTNWEELRVSIVLIVAIRLNFITYPGVLPPRIGIVSHYQSSVCLQVCTDCMQWLQGTCGDVRSGEVQSGPNDTSGEPGTEVEETAPGHHLYNYNTRVSMMTVYWGLTGRIWWSAPGQELETVQNILSSCTNYTNTP